MYYVVISPLLSRDFCIGAQLDRQYTMYLVFFETNIKLIIAK